jgi:hypothetical protein
MEISEWLYNQNTAETRVAYDEITTLRKQVTALEARNKELEALAEQSNRQDEARERWLDQLADECSDPNL